MKCLLCGCPCHVQTDLLGHNIDDYPNLCPACNKIKADHVLIISDDKKHYAFVPVERISKEGVPSEVPNIFAHPKNYWKVPSPMLLTCITKIYPYTADERKIREKILDLQSEKESLESEICELNSKIMDLEDELGFNPDYEIKKTAAA